MKETKNITIWTAIAVLLLVSLTSAAIVVLLVRFYKTIAFLIPSIFGVLCVLGILVCYLVIRKHSSPLKKRDWIIVAGSYGAAVLSVLLYFAGASLLIPWSFFMMVLLFVVNSHFAQDMSALLLYNANTIFTMTISETFRGLFWACFISDDWGTLFVTSISGMTFAAVGFIIAIISMLLMKSKFTQSDNQRLPTATNQQPES
ncbi:MAG: hypothetical protein IKU03_02455 [Bacteroidales bacterium]|nr:hypothetical protein [Bacteroidales bacterium]